MSGKLQIVISSRPQPTLSGSQARLSVWQRFKLLFTGIGMALIAVVALVLALIVGSIVAALLWIALVAAVVTLILKGTVRRTGQVHK
jgi:hypothetical protein